MRRLVILAVMLAMISAGCGGDDKPTKPTPTGACCAPTGTCTVTTQPACSGTWTATGVCDPNPCQQPLTESGLSLTNSQPTPVEKTSWGRLKQHYRDATR